MGIANNCLFSLCLLVGFVSNVFVAVQTPVATTTARTTATAKSRAAKSKTAAVKTAKSYKLPDIYSGVANPTRVTNVPGLGMGDYTCADPKPALPGTLKFICGATVVLSGTATVQKDSLVTSSVMITDSGKKTVSFPFQFALRAPNDTVDVQANLPAAPATSTPAAVDWTKTMVTETQSIVEGATLITGEFNPRLDAANVPKFSVRVLLKQDHDGEKLADLVAPGAVAGAATVKTVPVQAGGYLVTFAKPLAPGETVQVQIVPSDSGSNPVKAGDAVSLDNGIFIPHIGLRVDPGATAGTVNFSGRVNMPALKVAPAPNAVPPTQGNFPRIAVQVRDGDSGLWSPALLTPSPTDNSTVSQAVSDLGQFLITVKTALKSGQRVRVRVVPPDGRWFTTWPGEQPPDWKDSTYEVPVESALTLVQPSVSTILTEGTTSLTGIATGSGTAGAISVAVLRVEPKQVQDSGEPDPEEEKTNVCSTTDKISELQTRGKLLVVNSSGSSAQLTATGADGGWKLTLAEALKEGDHIQIVQVLPPDTVLAEPQRAKCASNMQQVRYQFDWHRTNITFVAGVLISNSSSTSQSSANFSQANQFYAINVDRAWRLPGADCVKSNDTDPNKIFGRKEYGFCGTTTGWHSSHYPGFTTFFEGRLTSVPVSTAASNPTATPTSGTTGTGTGTATATTSGSTLLTSQKVFRVATGAYLPWVLGHGPGHHPNGIFLAPLAKAGFDTVTGAGTNSVVLPGGGNGTLNYQTAYDFYAFGGRLGNMELSASHERAPKIDHYFDVTIGRYSNLESYICHTTQLTTKAASPLAKTSSCAVDYPQYFAPDSSNVVQSRKQLYRLDFEGLIKIPVPATAIPFYIGFNANIAQHMIGVQSLDHAYAPPDDIRILFGTKIDIGSLLSTLKLGTN